jgi:hypothetical protein
MGGQTDRFGHRGRLHRRPAIGRYCGRAGALGPNVASGHYDDIWLCFAGPVLGGLLAALLYTGLLKKKVSQVRLIAGSMDHYVSSRASPRLVTLPPEGTLECILVDSATESVEKATD